MAAILGPVGLSLACLLISTVSGKVTLKLVPEIVNVDLTKSQLVNCTVTDYKTTDIETLVSIRLSRIEEGEVVPEPKELVSINAFQKDQVRPSPSMPSYMMARGGVDKSGAFLTLQWSYPSDADMGLYICEATFMHTDGDTSTVKVDRVLRAQAAGIEHVLKRLQLVEANIEDNAQRETDLLRRLEGVEKDDADYRDALFAVSDFFDSHRYYLSAFPSPVDTWAQNICKAMGGYLAALGSVDEYKFVKEFLDTRVRVNSTILLGPTSNGMGPRSWTNRQTGGPVIYTNWWKEPRRAANQEQRSKFCMALFSRDFDTRMKEINCDMNVVAMHSHFLCEVP
ncbi:uncharacterized protein LOC101849230 [Aplysia californica]|uniref:Uncharacterized protein LOC101849230 n=1 Tax=Aplysia californica TaxID=6500 RepID=A0ABM0JZ95_APLCA|nr:uncharacterized protein LOC101849230 [Aplysia californica]